MFGDDGNESFQTAKDSTVNDDGPCRGFIGALRIFGGTILQVETLWKLEIELDRGALE